MPKIKIRVPVFTHRTPRGEHCPQGHPLVTPKRLYPDQYHANFRCGHGHEARGRAVHEFPMLTVDTEKQPRRPRTEVFGTEACTNCGATFARCEAGIARGKGPCCPGCVYARTHEY